jgi:hypothetical protein
MPAVIDTPEVVEHEEYALYEAHDQHTEQAPVREAHPGFWHTVLQYLRRQRVHTSYRTPSSSRQALHPIEMPMERLARQYPTLYIQAFYGV